MAKNLAPSRMDYRIPVTPVPATFESLQRFETVNFDCDRNPLVCNLDAISSLFKKCTIFSLFFS